MRRQEPRRHCRAQNTNISREISYRGKNRRFEEAAAEAGRNYYIKLRRRQNANKGHDCEEYYGAIKSRLRSIRVTKGRICT